MPRLAIVDCGIGNLFSIGHALEKIGFQVKIVSAAKELQDTDAIILPGVGNFKAGSENLGALRPEISQLIEDGVPILGICLGMQLLFERSEESYGKGLAVLRGNVVRLSNHVKIPHMGWNTLSIVRQNELLDGISISDHFYFVHSYYARPASKNLTVAVTDYGSKFASVIADRNIYGTQFHPEKSSKTGESILTNFSRIVKK